MWWEGKTETLSNLKKKERKFHDVMFALKLQNKIFIASCVLAIVFSKEWLIYMWL